MTPDWFLESFIAQFHKDQTRRPELYLARYQQEAGELWEWLYQNKQQIITEFLSQQGKEPRWAKAPWVEDSPGAEETRRRHWRFREWMYSPEEQAEILQRHPYLDHSR